MKKTYVIIIDRAITDGHKFRELADDIEVENETICTSDTSVLSKIMDLLIQNHYKITDIRTENNYDILRKYLTTGGKQNA